MVSRSLDDPIGLVRTTWRWLLDVDWNAASTGLAIALVALVVTALQLWWGRHDQRDEQLRRSRERFVLIRTDLKQNRVSITRRAATLRSPLKRDIPGSNLLVRPDWRPSHVLDIDDIQIHLDVSLAPQPPKRARRLARRLLPRASRWRAYEGFSAAINDLARPTLFFNGPTYSLVSHSFDSQDAPALSFCVSTYFETIDIAEALCHEVAGAREWALRIPLAINPWLRLRRFVGKEPLDPARRPVSVAITTLLLCKDFENGPHFFLNLRKPEATVTYAGAHMLVPTGVFQPGSLSPAAIRNDFSLWNNIMREFNEEVLGAPEASGEDGATVDYESQEPYRTMQEEMRRGRIAVKYLGFGLDPLELWPHLLTVMIIDKEALTRVAPKLAEENAEGFLLGHRRTSAGIVGIPFCEADIGNYLALGRLSSPSAACLSLAWLERDELMNRGDVG